jgi:NADPH-dependent curcumin reductase
MSTTPQTNRQYILKSRPTGPLDHDLFELRTQPLREPEPGEVLVRTLYLSIDPTIRLWLSERPQYMPPIQVGGVVRSGGLGLVVQSRNPSFKPGDLIGGLIGWQDYCVGDPNVLGLRPLPKLPVPPLAFLGPLAATGGLTAYFGLFDIGQPRAGETLVVSGAAGSVGSLVGQMGKMAGLRVVGIAGNDEGCHYVTHELGFDACINYKTEDVKAALARHCPDGIDIDFENVGGPILEAVLERMNPFGRVALCGLISQYDQETPLPGPSSFPMVLMRRLKVQGFLCTDFTARFPEAYARITHWLTAGKLKSKEHIFQGLESAPDALEFIFHGKKVGKLVVKVSDPPAMP